MKRLWKRLCLSAWMVLVCGMAAPSLSPGAGLAQAAERGKARARKGSAAKPSRPQPNKDKARRAPAAEKSPSTDSTSTETAAAAPAPPVEERAARPAGKPRVYTFGGLDLEGKLKTPQLLYFRGRMRQELDASSLQRRSFLKELEKTADDRGL